MSHAILDGVRATVTRARFELYHQDSPEADWNLELLTEGPIGRWLMSGTVAMPELAILEVAFVDDPIELAVGGQPGCLTSSLGGTKLQVRVEGLRAQITGQAVFTWNSIAGGGEVRPYVIDVEADAEIGPL
jgi:hypothetical protein